LEIVVSPEFDFVMNQYPESIKSKLAFLCGLILQTAAETPGIKRIEKTLKWGEPSFLTKQGSTIRVGWKKSKPRQSKLGQYALYFNCKTKLVDTFRECYSDIFNFEGNRAIVFEESDVLAIDELKHCIMLALTYHKRKHLPLLGV